jgi:hypothetical protein
MNDERVHGENEGDETATAAEPRRQKSMARARSSPDGREAEISAMVRIQKALASLPEESVRRVLAWFDTAYGMPAETGRGPVSRPQFSSIDEVFNTAKLSSEPERVLAACFFCTLGQKRPDVEVRTVSRELQRMGHAVRNPAQCFHSLMQRSPSLVMVTNPGSGKGNRKRYRLTSAGEAKMAVLMGGRVSPDGRG